MSISTTTTILHMNFDTSISETVTLSQILECYLDTAEKTAVVVQFLRTHDEDFRDITKNCTNLHKLYCSHFVLACSPADIEYLYRHIHDVDAEIAAYCIWQIMLVKSSKADALKYRISNDTKIMSLLMSFMHPHRSLSRQVTAAIDRRIANADDAQTEAAKLLSDKNVSQIDSITRAVANSLYATMFYDINWFVNYSAAFQMTLIRQAKKSLSDRARLSFVKRILTANDDIKIKNFAVDEIVRSQEDHFGYLVHDPIVDESIYDEVYSASCFSELYMKLVMQGTLETKLPDIVMCIIETDNVSFLEEAICSAYDDIVNYFPCIDYIEHRLKTRKI